MGAVLVAVGVVGVGLLLCVGLSEPEPPPHEAKDNALNKKVNFDDFTVIDTH